MESELYATDEIEESIKEFILEEPQKLSREELVRMIEDYQVLFKYLLEIEE